jgi:hypothetical protein
MYRSNPSAVGRFFVIGYSVGEFSGRDFSLYCVSSCFKATIAIFQSQAPVRTGFQLSRSHRSHRATRSAGRVRSFSSALYSRSCHFLPTVRTFANADDEPGVGVGRAVRSSDEVVNLEDELAVISEAAALWPG